MSDYAVVRVELGARSYEIRVGQGLLADAAAQLASLVQQSRVVIVTDRNVAEHHLTTLERGLKDAGIVHQSIILPPGEATKDFAHAQRLSEDLLDVQIERQTAVLAFGGGVVGDLAGFVASIVLRGIDFIQIPTTLLAQVDSSVGGKTGINTRHGKNLIGSFYQPRLVLADTDTLSTLPQREYLAGYAEVVKYGLIRDAAFFAWLEDHGAAMRGRDPAALRHAVVTSCGHKAAIVAADEREAGERTLLNLGHTFAHALEVETGYGTELLHGEAVAIGMVMAFELSARLGLCPVEDVERARRHLADMGLPTGLRGVGGRTWDPAALLGHMRQDKKVRDGKVTFVLTRGIGKAFLARDVRPEDVEGLLNDAIAA